VKIIWHSNAPWNSSGYGVQTSLLAPRIANLGHEVIISSPYSFSGTPLEWGGFKVLPCVRDTAGNDVIVANYDYYQADLMITLADVFGLLRSAKDLGQLNVAHWFPVDTDSLGDGDATVLREGGGVPIAMSRFGERALRAEGTDPLYAPHGVDTAVFCPGSPELFRDSVDITGPDTFVIGICAMNRDPLRKGLAEQFTAFSRFLKRHPDSVLAVHSVSVASPGLNLDRLAIQLGISSAISYPDRYSYEMGLITREQLATWYRGLDVLSLCSYGEGFGLPLIEAQACGIPVITTDGSAMSELCGSGWIVSGTPFWSHGHGAWWKRPDVEDIDAAYEEAWQARESGELAVKAKAAREFALLYDVDVVFSQHWLPIMDGLEKRFS
jgi:glycosyltransferase involved in cell wall biosynthesis